MKLLFYCILYILISISCSSVYSNVKPNILPRIKDSDYTRDHKVIRTDHAIPKTPQKRQRENEKNGEVEEQARFQTADVLLRRKPRTFEKYLDSDEKAHFRIDPVLNSFGRNGRRRKINAGRRNINGRRREINGRRRKKSGGTSDDDNDKDNNDSSDSSSSSTRELGDWKKEFKQNWIQKKYEAINSSYMPGDKVNMLAARPWGVPCGDPNQHDMPWGTCVMSMECDGEYRIYRGDHMCGRSQFVCCALQLTSYDMYQGFDPSFEASGLATDIEEKKQRGKGRAKKAGLQKKRKRQLRRKKTKRKINRQIKKIQNEIKKIIERQKKNATKARKRKTKQLKKFIDLLKRQYKKDRKSVIDLHEYELIRIDDVLKKKLDQIRVMNDNFIKNATFREVVVNGTLNRQAARMLLEAYPELDSYININVRRRSAAVPRDYLDYDVEYGLLYF